MKSALSWLLIVSLIANAYLLWQLNLHKKIQAAEPIPRHITTYKNSTGTPPPTGVSGFEQIVSNDSIEIVKENNVVNAPSEGVTLAFLRSLKVAKKFEALSFHVRSYLRANPLDTDALLLEAEAYYYTQPLNTALVNYYGLRDALLSEAQLEQINQLIDVNTTRIIQQFSGDASWDLLAAFLEPLVQVDPLNRRYILALAKAYGMQQQTVLMENVLAALPVDDARAQRLRESIYGEAEDQAPSELASNESTNDGFERINSGEVTLVERNGQYYTEVKLSNVEADLLIDTGASMTAVSQQVFDRISNNDTAYLGTFNVQTAGGNISSPVYRLAEITVGSEIINNVSVMVLPTQNMQRFDGLLGMNVVRRFNMSYDRSIGKMRMYKK